MTSKVIYRWKRVSIGDGDTYAPWNVPIDHTSRKFTFGQVESAGEVVVARVVDETAHIMHLPCPILDGQTRVIFARV